MENPSCCSSSIESIISMPTKCTSEEASIYESVEIENVSCISTLNPRASAKSYLSSRIKSQKHQARLETCHCKII